MSKENEQPWPHSLSEKWLFAFLYVLSFSIQHLPRSWQMRLGNGFGNFVYLCAGYRKQVVLDNLQRAFPELSLEDRQKMSRRHFHHLGNLALEYLWSPAFTDKELKRWVVLHGREHFDQALAQGKGAILLASHMGSGDPCGIALARMGFPMAVIGKRTKIHWVTRMLFGFREIHGIRALPEQRVASEIFRSLKRNELVIFVMDQFMGPPQGSETFFFGHPTGTTTSLAVFAQRTEAPVLSVWTYRDDKGVLHIVVEPPLNFENMTPLEATQKFNDELERVARQYPDQWFWVHQRWKKFIRH